MFDMGSVVIYYRQSFLLDSSKLTLCPRSARNGLVPIAEFKKCVSYVKASQYPLVFTFTIVFVNFEAYNPRIS